MTVASIRAGLVTRLETITGLNAYGHSPDGPPNLPAIYVRRVAGPKRTMLSGCWSTSWRLTLIVQRLSGEQGEDLIEPYTDVSGTSSIVAALEGDETLGGAAEYLMIGDWGDDRQETEAGIDYLTNALPVEVHYRG